MWDKFNAELSEGRKTILLCDDREWDTFIGIGSCQKDVNKGGLFVKLGAGALIN